MYCQKRLLKLEKLFFWRGERGFPLKISRLWLTVRSLKANCRWVGAIRYRHCWTEERADVRSKSSFVYIPGLLAPSRERLMILKCSCLQKIRVSTDEWRRNEGNRFFRSGDAVLGRPFYLISLW